MVDELEVAAALQVLMDAEIEANINLVNERRYNVNEDPFQLSERAFIRLFRLNKQTTRALINSLEEYLVPASRSSAIATSSKVLSALRFMASGSYQSSIGNDRNLCLSQSSVSRSLEEVTGAINNHLFTDWVKFPANMEELHNTRTRFYQKYHFPGIVGAIDGTHVAIFPPPADDPNYPSHMYMNRKGYYSINVQLVCDSSLKILNVNAKYPGRTHDSFIWQNSNLKTSMDTLYRNNANLWLLGDSGYPLSPILLTPLLDAEPNSPEERYNNAHKSARNTIETLRDVMDYLKPDSGVSSKIECYITIQLKHHKL